MSLLKENKVKERVKLLPLLEKVLTLTQTITCYYCDDISLTQMMFYDGYLLILTSFNCTNAVIGELDTSTKGKEGAANVINAAKGYILTFVC